MNAPAPIYAAWQFDPVLIGGILTVALAYALATGPLRQRLAPGEPYRGGGGGGG
jgi:hypothetical protein